MRRAALWARNSGVLSAVADEHEKRAGCEAGPEILGDWTVRETTGPVCSNPRGAGGLRNPVALRDRAWGNCRHHTPQL